MAAAEPRVVNTVRSTIRPNDHPYMNGAWRPNYQEVDAVELEVLEGSVPLDIPPGIYIRNTENPVHEPIGRYHPFDGDGMIHQARFHGGGRVSYRNRFVRTKGFLAEEAAGEALWAGLAENPAMSKRPGWGAQGSLKDASSTDVVVHAGKVLSTFYQCGDGYRLDPETLETLGPETWDGRFPVEDGGISAHCKVDEATGELLFFNYSKKAPYMHYGVVDASNRLVHYVPVPLPGPRLPHDMAFTEHYSILNDFPLFWDEKLLAKGVHANRLHKDLPSRFAVIPRYGATSEVRWFEATPTYVLHFLNAFEEVDTAGHTVVVLDGYRQLDPMPDSEQPFVPSVPLKYRRMMVYLDLYSMKPQLWRWRFNLNTGQTTEGLLDTDPQRITEFGTFNQRYAGRPNRYVWSSRGKPGWFLLSGITKHDLETGESFDYHFGEERYNSEAPFVPRLGSSAEDDGYLITFVTDAKAETSEVVLLDARHVERGPVCRLKLPHCISSGTHSAWATLCGDGQSQRPAERGARL